MLTSRSKLISLVAKAMQLWLVKDWEKGPACFSGLPTHKTKQRMGRRLGESSGRILEHFCLLNNTPLKTNMAPPKQQLLGLKEILIVNPLFLVSSRSASRM